MGEPGPRATPSTARAEVGDGRAEDETRSSAVVDADLPCYRCRYNLRALPGDGACPECGYAIATSVRLAPLRRWPITAENACGWLSLGMLTSWLCGAGLVLWLLGLGLLLRHAPADTPAQRWTRHATWGTLVLLVGAALLPWVVPASSYSTARFVCIALLINAHYISVMLLGLRLARDAKMPIATTLSAVLMAMPPFVTLALVTGVLQAVDGDMFVGLLILALCWFIVSGFYWMGVSGELGARRLDLLREAKVNDGREFKTKTL